MSKQLSTNKDIRNALARRNITQWQLADVMRIREEKLSRILRYELSLEQKAEIMSYIDQIGGETNDRNDS